MSCHIRKCLTQFIIGLEQPVLHKTFSFVQHKTQYGAVLQGDPLRAYLRLIYTIPSPTRMDPTYVLGELRTESWLVAKCMRNAREIVGKRRLRSSCILLASTSTRLSLFRNRWLGSEPEKCEKNFSTYFPLQLIVVHTKHLLNGFHVVASKSNTRRTPTGAVYTTSWTGQFSRVSDHLRNWNFHVSTKLCRRDVRKPWTSSKRIYMLVHGILTMIWKSRSRVLHSHMDWESWESTVFRHTRMRNKELELPFPILTLDVVSWERFFRPPAGNACGNG